MKKYKGIREAEEATGNEKGYINRKIMKKAWHYYKNIQKGNLDLNRVPELASLEVVTFSDCLKLAWEKIRNIYEF